MDCPNDINGMIDCAKIADLSLLLIDASRGFEMVRCHFEQFYLVWTSLHMCVDGAAAAPFSFCDLHNISFMLLVLYDFLFSCV